MWGWGKSGQSRRPLDCPQKPWGPRPLLWRALELSLPPGRPTKPQRLAGVSLEALRPGASPQAEVSCFQHQTETQKRRPCCQYWQTAGAGSGVGHPRWELSLRLGRSCRGPAYRWALCEEASGAKEEMAEQFPEEGGKIPWLGFQDTRQTWAPRPLPGLGSGEMQRSTAPPPANPDRTGVSLGFFASPLPKPRRTFPWYPYSHQSVLSFPSGTPTSLLNAPVAHHPLEAPLPCCCTRFPLAPWHPLNSQLAPPMSLCFPVPTTLAESCPGSLFWGPLALAPGRHWGWGPGGASEGTAGAAAPRSATHVVLGLLGGGEVLVGTLQSRRPASSLAVPELRGAGVRAAAAQARAPGVG